MNGLKNPNRPALAIRTTPLSDPGLQRPHQIERENAHGLPGAVGLVALRRHAVEGEAAFELAVNLLVGATATEERSQGPARHRLVRDDRRVPVVAVVRIEQIQLVVLRGMMPDPLAVGHEP